MKSHTRPGPRSRGDDPLQRWLALRARIAALPEATSEVELRAQIADLRAMVREMDLLAVQLKRLHPELWGEIEAVVRSLRRAAAEARDELIAALRAEIDALERGQEEGAIVSAQLSAARWRLAQEEG
jgi:hypothetical protein